jgi:hypothetical protein
LTGVQPTGTSSGQWSILAKELTSATLNDQLVYVVFEGMSASGTDTHSVSIYMDAKTTNRHAMPNLKEHTFDGVAFVRFADILNHNGLALLLEKQAPLNNIFLANKKVIQTQAAALVTMPSLMASYKTELPRRMYRNSQNNMDAAYEAVACFVQPRLKKNTDGTFEYACYVNLQTSKLPSFKLRNDMKIDFEKCYKSNETSCRMPLATIEEAMRQERRRQACVCKPASDFRFYRGEIIDKTSDDNCFLVRNVDSGQVSIVHYINIYRAMTKYLPTSKLAFKVIINVDADNMIEEVSGY